jgi:homopolymeric O-antigen transport system permease protein
VLVEPRILELDGRPLRWTVWWRDLWSHRSVLLMLSRADFHVRYKRAAFGVVWAVIVPLIQSAVLAIVFSHIIRVNTGSSFAAYVLGGVLAWSYFGATLASGSTAIVEGRNLTDKVWFPRAMLPIVPALGNIVGLAVSLAILIVMLPLFGGHFALRLFLLPAAVLLLLAFTISLSLVLAGLHVYFRDVRFLVQAALLVWFYVTPIAYPARLLGHLAPYLSLNPMTGVVDLFRMGTVGSQPDAAVAVGFTVLVTVLLLIAAGEIYRRHDRLFVDRL